MKLLFETVNGKKVLKEFENGTLAKNFIVKNKDKLSKATIMESEALDLSDTQKKFVSRFEGNGQLIPYKGKKTRRWKTYESKGTIQKGQEYYIEEDVSGKYEYGAVNVYEPVGKSLRFLFKMSKKHLDEWFIKISNISKA